MYFVHPERSLTTVSPLQLHEFEGTALNSTDLDDLSSLDREDDVLAFLPELGGFREKIEASKTETDGPGGSKEEEKETTIISDELLLLTHGGWIEEDLNNFDLLGKPCGESECFLSPSVADN